MEDSLEDKCFKIQKEQKDHIQKSLGISDIQKSFSHKYIGKKPDGRGGWIYEYPEDKSEVSKDDKYFVERLAELKKEKDKIDVEYNYYQSMFELKNAFESLKWGKIDYEDFAVERGNIKESDKREGKPVFDKYDYERLLDFKKGRFESGSKSVLDTFKDYKDEIDQKQVSEFKKMLKAFEKARMDKINFMESYIKEGYGY